MYRAGTDECGTPIHHEGYCTQAEDSRGNRWNHNKVFLLSDFIKKAEGDRFKAKEMLEQTMGVLFDKMKKHVDNGGKLNSIFGKKMSHVMDQMLIVMRMDFNKLS